MNNSIKWILSGAVLALGLMACGKNGDGDRAKPAKTGGAAAVTVTTVIALRQDVPIVLQASAAVVPLKSVELHPLITSKIKKVHIAEGQFVRAGELLFTLDDRGDQANLAKAQAQVLRDQAVLRDLERQYQRNQRLVAQKFLSQGTADTLQSQIAAQRALLVSDAAAVRVVQIGIDDATLRAPLAGRVGAINVFAGSLVQVGTALATITQLDPIGVSFNLPESQLRALLDAQQRGPVPVEAQLGGSQQRLAGKLSFIDNSVDPQAGVIRVKAMFSNRDGLLWPGQYVNTQVIVETLSNAVVVPQAAIINNTGGAFVYAMAADKNAQAAQSMPVTVLYAFGENAVVSGLAGGEKIIVEGKQNLYPGSKVQEAKPAKPANPALLASHPGKAGHP
jgi:multidrug efflux system membrane fusion protein